MGVFVRTRWGGVYGGGGGIIAFIGILAAISLVVAAKLWWITLPILALLVAARIYFDKRYTGIHQREHVAPGKFQPHCTFCLGELETARTAHASRQQHAADQDEWRRLQAGDPV